MNASKKQYVLWLRIDADCGREYRVIDDRTGKKVGEFDYAFYDKACALADELNGDPIGTAMEYYDRTGEHLS